MLETTRIEQWLYEVLSGDSALAAAVGGRIYAYLAPPEAGTPFVVFAYQSGADTVAIGMSRVLTAALYQVKVVGTGWSSAPLQPIADRIDAVLQAASGSVVDGQILGCTREQPISYVEATDGVVYRHLGGLYRIYAR